MGNMKRLKLNHDVKSDDDFSIVIDAAPQERAKITQKQAYPEINLAFFQ
jgi:hypothetical protein